MQCRPKKFDPQKPQILIVEAGETLQGAMERQRMRTGYGGGFFIYFNRGPKPPKSTRGPNPAFA
jgi:hypothetical protein